MTNALPSILRALPREAIDVNAAPRIEFLDGDGKLIADHNGAVAFRLPDCGLMFAVETRHFADGEDHAPYIAGLTLLGYTDWRDATDMETPTLVSRAHREPATWPALAAITPITDWYRTSTPLTRPDGTSVSGFAWYVHFSNGNVNYNHRNNSGFVRVVRSVPPSECRGLSAVTVKIIAGDCRETLRNLPAGIADACIADPPYGDTSLEWDRQVPGWIEQIARVLKPAASIWVFGSLRYLAAYSATWKRLDSSTRKTWCGRNRTAQAFMPIAFGVSTSTPCCSIAALGPTCTTIHR